RPFSPHDTFGGPMGVREAVEAAYGDRDGVPEVLYQQALALARVLDDDFEHVRSAPPAKAPVSKELREVLAQIDAALPQREVSPVDDLASRRAARRSA